MKSIFDMLRFVLTEKRAGFVVALCTGFAMALLHFHFGLFGYVRTNTNSIYDLSTVSRQCMAVSSLNGADACLLGNVRWVRLDSAFYQLPESGPYPTNRATIATLLARIEAQHPRLIALDLGLTGDSHSEMLLRYLLTRAARCGMACTPIVFATTRDGAGGWEALPYNALIRARTYPASVELDEDAATLFPRTFRPSIVGCEPQETPCRPLAMVTLPLLSAILARSDVRPETAWARLEGSFGRLRCGNTRCTAADEHRVETTFLGNLQSVDPNLAIDADSRNIHYAFGEPALVQSSLSISARCLLVQTDPCNGFAHLHNTVVFVGAALGGLGAVNDEHSTPLGLMSGTVILINVFETLRHGGLRSFGQLGVPVRDFLIGFVILLAAFVVNLKNEARVQAWIAVFTYLVITLAVGFALVSMDLGLYVDIMAFPFIWMAADLGARACDWIEAHRVARKKRTLAKEGVS